MTDLDQMLQADAQRWRADARPVLDLDDQLAIALVGRSHQPSRRRFVAPTIAAAVILALAALVLASRAFVHHGAPPAATAPANIRNVVWHDPHSSGTVTYRGSTMRTADGCANQRAHLIIRNGRLIQGQHLGRIGTCSHVPMPAGPQGLADRAAARQLAHFYAVIAGPAAWSRDGNVLTLTTLGKGTLHLTANRIALTVADTSWDLIGYSGANGHEHQASMVLGLYITADGKFQADLDCSTAYGHADVTPTHIQFTNVRGLRHCSYQAGAAVAKVIQAATARYAIRGDKLIITSRAGTLIYQM